MPRESDQSRIGRVRAPRVHITYDVETEGEDRQREIPFVLGILADLSGVPEEPLPDLEQRPFIDIDRDNIDVVMAKQAPRLLMSVPDRLTPPSKPDEGELESTAVARTLEFPLTFERMSDFHPEAIAKRIPALRELLDLRTKLSSLQDRLYGNNNLDQAIQEAIKEATQKFTEIRQQAGSRGNKNNG